MPSGSGKPRATHEEEASGRAGASEGSGLRESRLIERVERAAEALPARIRIGPGDDMALLDLEGHALLAAVDQVVEGVHFVRGTDEAAIARKAVARNLSDVAAMAARPIATLASCVLAPEWEEARAARLIEALAREALAWECPLVGGDTALHRRGAAAAPLVLSVTILAEPWPEADGEVVRRGRAAVGDGIWVTGRLGGSFGADGRGRHLAFEPRVSEARALRSALGARLHSMIDVSDGLGRDAAALAGPGVQILLDADRIPCHEGCDWRRALGDGEDHELCFAAAGPVPESLAGRSDRTPVTRIGEVIERRRADEPAALVRTPDGVLDATRFGWEHRADESGR